MPMRDTYVSVAPMDGCRKMVTTTGGEKLIFDAQNNFISTFQVTQIDNSTSNQNQIQMMSTLDDRFNDSSDMVIFGVIGLLVCGVFGVVGFLQYKFVICKEFLCIKCDKKKSKKKN